MIEVPYKQYDLIAITSILLAAKFDELDRYMPMIFDLMKASKF